MHSFITVRIDHPTRAHSFVSSGVECIAACNSTKPYDNERNDNPGCYKLTGYKVVQRGVYGCSPGTTLPSLYKPLGSYAVKREPYRPTCLRCVAHPLGVKRCLHLLTTFDKIDAVAVQGNEHVLRLEQLNVQVGKLVHTPRVTNTRRDLTGFNLC